MQPQFNQPIFVKVERYDSQAKEIYTCVIQVKDILEVSQTHVLFTNGQLIRLTEESMAALEEALVGSNEPKRDESPMIQF